MRQAQQGFQHAHQGPPRGALLRLAAALDLHLGQLEIPVADEFVDGARQQVEAVVGEVLLDLRLNALQAADDPAVGRREVEVAAGAGIRAVRGESAVLALAVHQHEA